MRLAAGLVAASLAACGDGSGEKPDQERTVRLAANGHISPWTTDELSFEVSPALAEDEAMSCRIDDGPEVSCATSPSSGRVTYSDLARGEHVLSVKAGTPGDQKASNAHWQIVNADVLVYGGTPAGIVAALSAARAGRTVVLVEASSRLGGMMSGGSRRQTSVLHPCRRWAASRLNSSTVRVSLRWIAAPAAAHRPAPRSMTSSRTWPAKFSRPCWLGSR